MHRAKALARDRNVGIRVANFVTFVEYYVAPSHGNQVVSHRAYHVVCRDNNRVRRSQRLFEALDAATVVCATTDTTTGVSDQRPTCELLLLLIFVLLTITCACPASPIGTSVEDANMKKTARPLYELVAPLLHHGGGAYDQRWLVETAAMKGCKEGADLHGFPKPHLVADDSSGTLCVQFAKPLHARLLVAEQLVPYELWYTEAFIEQRDVVCTAAWWEEWRWW